MNTTQANMDLINRRDIFDIKRVKPEDIPLLDLETPEQDEPTNEATYTANVADFSSPVARRDRDTTDLQKEDPTKDPMIKATEEYTEDSAIEPKGNYVPSDVVDYYNETAMKAKKRNSLPDSEFGLPRLRAYPLNDKAHVKQAIRMFGHCKDPKDRKTLANNIFTAMEKHGVDMKIGKGNALYEYAPESLREDAGEIPFHIAGFEKKMSKRTREDVIREHLRVNGSFYNNVFYGNEYAKAVKGLDNLTFLEYFYPDLKRMPFPVRLSCVCGGLATESADIVYPILKIRKPLHTDFTKELGWSNGEDIADELEMAVSGNYNAKSNWFGVNLSDDLDHIHFCLRLYSVMGEILLDPNFSMNVNLDAKHTALLMDWGQRVGYHYDLYLEARPDSTEQLRQIQYLFDLFWLYTDNPYSEDAISVNIISVLNNMRCVDQHVISMNEANISGEIISKEECNKYLVHDLGLEDDMYLLPGLMEYPIVDRNSIRLAMDCINMVDAENRAEFVKNLNRKYKEFGCTFSISVDHPYAKYADDEIILHMTQMLLEGDTAVDDQGTSTTASDRAEQPWYKRLDVVKGVNNNIIDNNRELGPSAKDTKEPDYTPIDSFM